MQTFHNWSRLLFTVSMTVAVGYMSFTIVRQIKLIERLTEQVEVDHARIVRMELNTSRLEGKMRRFEDTLFIIRDWKNPGKFDLKRLDEIEKMHRDEPKPPANGIKLRWHRMACKS